MPYNGRALAFANGIAAIFAKMAVLIEADTLSFALLVLSFFSRDGLSR